MDARKGIHNFTQHLKIKVMEFMFFKEWYVYNKINNQDIINQGLENLIPLSQISESLKTFWSDHFNQLSSNEQQTIKLKYHNYIKQNI